MDIIIGNREKWCGVAVGQRQVTGEKTKKQKKQKKVKLRKVFVSRLYLNILRNNDFWVFVLVDNLLILYRCVTHI